ncbi:hypothetical protein H6F67_15105 [Microcoleus sp. FACHB-1515]|nr:hypothetical protein [Microcoleus sp. FACHB-1515]MBD2091181.1 hypothetical protein [Microcoleus sp. FACHB-1515]
MQTEVLLAKLGQYLGVDYKYEPADRTLPIAAVESIQHELAAMPADWIA